MKHEVFEEMIVEDIISKHADFSENLRAQFACANIEKREFTPNGFVTYYIVDDSSSLGNKVNIQLQGDPWYVNELKYGSGFSLQIENGRIRSLKGWNQDGWPRQIHFCEKIQGSNVRDYFG